MKAIKCGFILIFTIFIAAGCPAGNEHPEKKDISEKFIVQGNNAFAVELYAKLRTQEGNLFFSPYSVSAALAMTYAGARGKTETQMAEVLRFPWQGANDKEQFHQAFGAIIKDLNARGGGGKKEVIIANALWGQKGYEFLKGFLRCVEDNYDGRLNEVDFAGDTESARKTINAW